MAKFKFRIDGKTVWIEAADKEAAQVKAQADFDQKKADERAKLKESK
jgi:hypothetical protein